MAYFDIQPFASTNPAVGQLFASEFAQRAAQRQTDQQAAANEIARQQIMAQSQLAQAQLRGQQQSQDQANLFRMQQLTSQEKAEEARNKILQQQADTDKAARVPRTDLEAERRKSEIIDANAAAINDAQRANALYQIEVNKRVADAKAAGHLFTWEKSFDDPNHPVRQKINRDAFDAVYLGLKSEKGTAQSLIPDPDTFTFKPVQYDETGKAIVPPKPTLKPPGDPSNPGAAALDATPNVAPPDAAANPAALGPMSPEAQAITAVGQPIVDKVLSSAADMFGIKAPVTAPVAPTATLGTPSVRRLLGSTTVLLTPEDDAVLQRQLIAIPAEQRPAAYKAIIGQLLQSRRAVLPTPQPTDPLDFRSLMN
jgi:hypothetical protein